MKDLAEPEKCKNNGKKTTDQEGFGLNVPDIFQFYNPAWKSCFMLALMDKGVRIQMWGYRQKRDTESK